MPTRPISRSLLQTLGIVLAALALLSCQPAREQDTGAAGMIRYRMPQDPPTLDPHDADDESSNLYVYNLFDGLVEFAPGTLDVVPAVAESWEISDGGRTYTFRLRKGVLFHNGREVTADDVVYSLRRALEKGRRAAPRRGLMKIEGAAAFAEGAAGDLTGVSAPDPGTVVLRLTRPDPSLLTALATQSGSIVPREIYDDPGKAYLRHPVGCGPFSFGTYVSGEHLTLPAFAQHWKGKPALPGLEIRIIPDVNTALLEYRQGGLEICNEVAAGRRKATAEELGPEYRVRPRLATAYLLINHASGPLSTSPELRRAVNFAVDRERIASVLQEGKDRATSWILPDQVAAGRTGAGPFRYDPDEARRILAGAGHEGGKGIGRLTLLSQDNESIRRSMESVQNDLKEIGLDVELEALEFGAYLQAFTGTPEQGPSADLVLLVWYPDYPDPEMVMRALFHSGSPTNFGRYRNPAVDALLDDADAEPDEAHRQELFLEAEQAVLRDGGVVPLYQQGDDLLVKPSLRGVVQTPLGDFAIHLEQAGLAP